MKKTLVLITAMSSMVIAAPGNGMIQQEKGMKKQGCMQMPKSMHMRKMQKQKMNSPFLIKQGLPHLMKTIMSYLNDPIFNLSDEQKQQLATIRKEIIGTIKSLKPEVIQIKKRDCSGKYFGYKSRLTQRES